MAAASPSSTASAPRSTSPTSRSCTGKGRSRSTSNIVLKPARRHPHRLPAAVRHDPVARHRGHLREQGQAHPLQVLHRLRRQARRRHLRPRPPADATRQHVQVGRPRATAPNAACSCCTARSAVAKSTIARLLKRGLEEYCRTDAGHAVHLLLEERRTAPGSKTRCTASRCNSSPRSTGPRCSRMLNENCTKPYPYDVADQGRPLARTAATSSRRGWPSTTATGSKMLAQRGEGLPPDPVARRTASASAPSSRRTRRTRTAPN